MKAPKVTKPKAASKTRTVNIFDVLKKIDGRDESYYDVMSENDQKQLHPLVLTRWMSGTSDPSAILILNHTINRYNFSLTNHKPLLMRMLLVAATGRSRHYKWLPKTKETSKSKAIQVLRQFYNCSEREAKLYVQHHTIDEIIDMANHIGWQKDEVKALVK